MRSVSNRCRPNLLQRGSISLNRKAAFREHWSTRNALSTGGIDYGLVFGGSKTILRGRVSNIWRPSDVAGVYGAAGAGLAIGRGARAIVLSNQKGAVLELSGTQTGLMANADLSGLAITMR